MHRRGAVVSTSLPVCLAIALGAAGAARAQGPAFLVKDINTTQAVREPYEDQPSSNPSGFTVLGGVVYFAAGDVADSYGEGPNGVELWRSDGTSDGTRLVRDIYPGPGSSDPLGLQVYAGALHFLARDSERGWGWWRSDGTAAGTELLGASGSVGRASPPVRSGSRWLTMLANEQGMTLWSVDADGRFETVAVLSSEPTYSAAPELIAGDRVAYFSFFHPDSGDELWRTDGTAAGTRIVADIEPGAGSSSPRAVTVIGDTAFFAARNEAHGDELWRADAAGATLVADLVPGPGDSLPTALTVLNGTLVFAVHEAFDTTTLWRTNGTSAGTVRITQVGNRVQGEPFTRVGDALYFGSGTTTPQLWRTDGTDGGTVLVSEFETENQYFIEPAVADAGGYLLVLVGRYLWRSDGTPAGTTLLRAFRWITGRYQSSLSGALAASGAFVFPADDGTGVEPWRSDGTAEGTRQLIEINPGATDMTAPYSDPALTDLDGTLVFLGDQPWESGEYLWKSDGTEAGTRSVGGILPAVNLSPLWLIGAGDHVYFPGDSAETGFEIWQTSLLDEPARLLADIYPGPFNSYPVPLGKLDGEIVFAAENGVSGTELWAPYGSGLIGDLAPGREHSWPREAVLLADGLYFLANGELWRTDGTAPGTIRVAYVAAGRDALMIGGGGRLAILTFWRGCPDFPPYDWCATLWYSDGTAEGTVRLRELLLPPGSDGSERGAVDWPRLLAFVDSTLIFSAGDAAHGVELWRSDGTVSGTGLLADINPGPEGSYPDGAASRGDAVLVFADDGVHGREPWITDGTTVGTGLIADLNPGPLGSRRADDESPAVVGDVFVFAAADGDHGLDLWRSDGTAAGTSLLDDIAEGARSSSPTWFTRSGEHLFFTANDNLHGRELWAVALDDVGCTVNCPDPHAPTPTPRRTPRPVWTPVPPLPTHTATVSPTPRSTPHCNQHGDGEDCVFLTIDSVTGAPGERVDVGVTLRTGGLPVAGVQLDILVDPVTGAQIVTGESGRPECRVNPAIGKDATAFTDLSTGLRVLVLSLTNVDPIADGSVLFTCTYEIAADTAPGALTIYCQNEGASTPEGGLIAPVNRSHLDNSVGELVCTDGAIAIQAGPAPTGTPGGGSLRSSAGGGGCQIGGDQPAGELALPMLAAVLLLLLPRIRARRGIIRACHASRRNRPRARAAPRASA